MQIFSWKKGGGLSDDLKTKEDRDKMHALHYFRQSLLSRKKEILNRLEKIYIDKTRKNGPLDQDLDDQAIDLENNEVIDHIDQIEREELRNINTALLRIQSGSYGFCITCQKKISQKRLKAVPFATQCKTCIQKSYY